MAKLLLIASFAVLVVAISSTQECGPHQVYNSCGPGCPQYCGRPSHAMCGRPCQPGCFCEEGYIFEPNLETCIPLSACPNPPVCPQNQVYRSCGGSCPHYCGKPNDGSLCIQVCSEGCYCAAGYVFKNAALGICIPTNQCLA